MAHCAKYGSFSELKLKHNILFQCFLIENWFASTEKSKIKTTALQALMIKYVNFFRKIEKNVKLVDKQPTARNNCN